MAEDDKPINPMERQEKVGVVDGTATSKEPIAEGRHGYGKEVTPSEVDEAIPRVPGYGGAPDKPQ